MMKRAVTERNIVVLLFVFVFILFSLADRDSKRLKQLYTAATKAVQKIASAKTQ